LGTHFSDEPKFFEQQELQQYIEAALDGTAVPVALGVFYVFRDPADQKDFLSARSRRTIDWTQISARFGLGRPRTIGGVLEFDAAAWAVAGGRGVPAKRRVAQDDWFAKTRRCGCSFRRAETTN
jgi:hypothetical protein